MYYEIIDEMLSQLVLEKNICSQLSKTITRDILIKEGKKIENVLSEYGSEVEHQLKEIQELNQFYIDQDKCNEEVDINVNVIIQLQEKLEVIINSIKKK